MLIVFNILTYDKILKFEQTLSNQVSSSHHQSKVRYNSRLFFRISKVRVTFNNSKVNRKRRTNASSTNGSRGNSIANANEDHQRQATDADNIEMIQLVSEQEQEEQLLKDGLEEQKSFLTRIKSIRRSNGSVRASQRASSLQATR